jgi:hypothetical protein
MYCPGCAAQNPDSAKYCRICGVDLEVVAIALAGQNEAVEDDKAGQPGTPDWMRKTSTGVRNTTQGAILLFTSLLIAVALGLFSNKADWMVIWTIFFGWMACWGVISLAFGVGALLEGRVLSRHSTLAHSTTSTSQLSPAADQIAVQSIVTAPTGYSGMSVTENTTEHLGEQRPQNRASE